MRGGVVVVGGGQAGVEAALGVRAAGYDRSVTLVCGEAAVPYRRPPLSKGFLDEIDDIEDIVLRAAPVYDERNIAIRLGVRGASIDRFAKQLELDDGGTLPYEWLILATGAEPRALPLAGSDAAGIFVLRTLDDSLRLRDALGAARNVVILGGGFIGLEVAVSARKRGATVTVLELAPRLMGRAVSEELSAYALEFQREMGIDVRLGVSVASLDVSAGSLRGVNTDAGDELPADVMVVGIGVRVETGFASDAGLVVDDGIVVDEFLRTSDPSIFAIGDCARFPTPFAQDPVRLESVQNATDQASHVARQIVTGTDEVFEPVPWFWSHQGDLKIQLAGLTMGSDRTLVTGDVDGGHFSVLRFRGGVLAGVDSVNDVTSHQSARRLLASRQRVTFDEAAKPGFEIKQRALRRPA